MFLQPENLPNSNTEHLTAMFKKLKPSITYDEIINIWNTRNSRYFRLNISNKWEIAICKECFGAPTNADIENELICVGFYEMPVKKPIDWNRSPILMQIREQITEQFIIEGYNRRSYYIFGNIGVGKTTLLTAIGRIFSIFLNVRMHFITMLKLIKLLTSIDKEDKKEVERLEKIQILFIDDLGLEKFGTDYQEAIARDFLAYRYGNNLTTFLCGNADIRRLNSQSSFYRQLSDYLNDSEAFVMYKITGNSKRK
jgi:hypothetical protein